MNELHSDDGFDRAMRDRYQQALQHVSPATRARLAATRHAATRGDATPVRGWPLGAILGGCAAVVFAITLGLNFNQGMTLDGGQPSVPIVAGDLPASAPSGPSPVTALDQDPDFYAWLESSDAQLMAME